MQDRVRTIFAVLGLTTGLTTSLACYEGMNTVSIDTSVTTLPMTETDDGVEDGDGDGDSGAGDGDDDADPGDGDGDGDGDPGDGDGDGDGESDLCGNAVVDPGEQCDFGPETMSCDGDCTYAMCGDGHHNLVSEQCDDGNDENDDTCVGPCLAAVCGDGFVHAGVEECDDENLNDDDDCTNVCAAAFCGDGIVHAEHEECDDANMADDDACTAQCTTSFCGDGVLWQGMETCDDGNTINTDACPSSCEPASCGDGFVQMGVEECDDQNVINNDNCLNACVDASCGDGYVKAGVEECDDGNMDDGDDCPNNCGIDEIGCMEILTNMSMWGKPARGVDLRDYTNSTLHWIGCNDNGCLVNSFYCIYDPLAHTMQFGTNSVGALRSVVDPNDAHGDVMPNAGNSCCTANSMQICNAPDSNNNGVNVVMVDALCAALGYSDGTIVREVANNSCPQAHAIAQDGSSWSSDYLSNQGYGAEYLCSN